MVGGLAGLRIGGTRLIVVKSGIRKYGRVGDDGSAERCYGGNQGDQDATWTLTI